MDPRRLGSTAAENGFVAHLDVLRGLPTGFGVAAYCARLGFDYETTKRDLFGFDPVSSRDG